MWRLVTIFLALAMQSAMACTIRIAYSDTPSPPYYLGEGLAIPDNPGIAVELVNMAAANIGCRIEWSRMPNKRVQYSIENGQIDAMLLFSYNEERAAYAVYPMKDGAPDPALRLTALTYRVYVKEGSPVKWNGKTFSHLNGAIGVNTGYSIALDIGKLGLSVEDVAGTERNLRKLQLGRLAAYVMQDQGADLVIEDKKIAGISKLPLPFSTKDYYLPVSRRFFDKSPEVAQRLWKQITEVRKAKGKELIRKYSDAI